MKIINNLFFNIFLVVWTISYGIVALPFLLLPSYLAIYSCKPWIYLILKVLKLFCGVKYEVQGKENIARNRQAIFMAKHHSPLETLLLSYLIKKPVYILKKELIFIPFVGLYFIITKMITIDKNSYAASFRKMILSTRERIAEGRNVIIFPEGGRVGINDNVQYQRGISVLYTDRKLDNIDFIPVALNCGLFWPIGIFDKKKPGTAIIKFLPPIKKDLSRNEFMHKLKDSIDSESRKLVKNALNNFDNQAKSLSAQQE